MIKFQLWSTNKSQSENRLALVIGEYGGIHCWKLEFKIHAGAGFPYSFHEGPYRFVIRVDNVLV